MYDNVACLQGPFIKLKNTNLKWRQVGYASRLKLLFKVVPTTVVRLILKRRNAIHHGGKMSFNTMIMEININLHLIDASI